MNRLALVLIVGLAAAGDSFIAVPAAAPQTISSVPADVSRRLNELEQHVDRVDSRINRGTGGAVLFLFGAFCALWAQNTKRDPWAWFFLGAIFNVFAVISLLIKN